MAWPNPSSMVRDGLNHVTDSRNPIVKYLASSKTGPQVASELRVERIFSLEAMAENSPHFLRVSFFPFDVIFGGQTDDL